MEDYNCPSVEPSVSTLSPIWFKTLSDNSHQFTVAGYNGFWAINFQGGDGLPQIQALLKLETAAIPSHTPKTCTPRIEGSLGKLCYRMARPPSFLKQQHHTKQLRRLHKGYSETSCNEAKSSKLLSKYLPQGAACPWLLPQVILQEPWHIRTRGGHPLFYPFERKPDWYKAPTGAVEDGCSLSSDTGRSEGGRGTACYVRFKK